MSRKISFIFIALFLIVSGGLFAQQNAQELRLGSIVTGNLNSGAEIWYRINVTENCFFTVETLGNIDTYLELYDSQRNLLLENDDGGDNSNAKIEILASSGSSYLVKLRGYDRYSSGTFRILADQTPLPDFLTLSAESVSSGNLSAGQKIFYRFQSTGAGIITVETSSNIDTYLEAYDSLFKFIASDDDSGGNSNARIDVFVEANKIYYFVLRGYSNSASGPYRVLTAFESMNVSNTNNTSRSAAVAINLGEGVTVFFTTSGQSRWFSYQVTRTGIITFTVQTRGNLDTWLNLYDNNGNLLEENDDSGDSYNALISTRLNAGTYYIEVKTLGGETGRCTLHAEIR